MEERLQRFKSKLYQWFHKYKDPVYRQFLKYKERDMIYIIPFVLLSLKVRLQYFYFLLSSEQGFPQSDDTRWYIHYAQSLIANHTIGRDMNDILYIGYNFLLALLLAICKDPVYIIFIQAVTAALCVILVYKIAQMLFNRTTAVIASFIYCYHAWAITLWSSYILSDSFFISLQLLCVYFLLKWMETKKNSYKILFFVMAFYLFIFRPAGIITVLFMMMYLFINAQKETWLAFLRKYKYISSGLLAAVIVTFAVLFMGGKLDPLLASMQFNAKKVLYNIYANGWIFDSPSPHDHHFKPNYKINIMNSLIMSFLVNNWDHIMVIYGKRAAAFIGRWVWSTDLTSLRGMVKFVEQAFPTILFFIGSIAAVWNGLFRKSSIVWLIIVNVYIFCIIFFIDGMYRYKAPAIPFIAVAIAYGGDRVIRGAIFIVKYAWMRLGAKGPASAGQSLSAELNKVQSG
ncbi:glycosyltransferase family 39 protein [Paenibacillus allorhizosphaerae]|uniref:glycosyltransferase family 39 protein n=1 Tax=Paenibacillus allorhizosphaerae TaxID=2849866 RepID=UPI001C405DDE|nr:glycosyltransferase family 39 protein [Paenibacillus allorhizosphaerae]